MFHEFAGFPEASFEFLRGLERHNAREWFVPRQAEYQRLLLNPLQGLVEELAPSMRAIDPLFVTAPAVNKTISRIYRDTRFSKDKSPYRTRQWLTFKRPSKAWQHHPAYFFELAATGYRYGMGFYCADRRVMDRFRAALDADPGAFLAAIDAYRRGQFVLEGECYKRPRVSADPEFRPLLGEWYTRKSFYLVSVHPVGPGGIPASLAAELAAAFAALAPLYGYLVEVVES